jgi:hypothetical protein
MRLIAALSITAAYLTLSAPVQATPIAFKTDPFAGSDALTTPGRQVVGGEIFIDFDVLADVFVFERDIFNAGSDVLFANDFAANLPTGGVNVVVLRDTDNDNDTTTPFNAGTAANLIAAQIATSGPGFFIYFNQGLDLPRLVFSTDLSDNTADLKILARMLNLSGNPSALATFTASNFKIVPEPSTLLLMIAGGLWLGRHKLRRRIAD